MDAHPLAHGEHALGEQRVVGGREDLGHAAGLDPVQSSGGTGMASRSWTTASSAWPPPPTTAMTRSPTAKRSAPGPAATTSPASSRPGCPPAPGRGRVAPGPLHQVGAVDAGRLELHQDLTDARDRVGVISDLDCAIDDGGGAHGARLGPRVPGRTMSSVALGICRRLSQPAKTCDRPPRGRDLTVPARRRPPFDARPSAPALRRPSFGVRPWGRGDRQ